MTTIESQQNGFQPVRLKTFLTKERLIQLRELYPVRHVTGALDHSFQLFFGNWAELLKEEIQEYCKKKKIEMDATGLAILALELYLDLERVKSKDHLDHQVRPFLYSGAQHLLKAIEAYKEHPLYIEQILIHAKNKEKDQVHENSSIAEKRQHRDPTAFHHEVTGTEPLKFIFESLSKADLTVLKEMAQKEEAYETAQQEEEKETFFKARRQALNALCQFMDRYGKVKSVRQRNVLAGRIFFETGNFVSKRSNSLFKSKKEADTFIADNVKKIIG